MGRLIKMILRQYQQEAIDKIWATLMTEPTALCVLSTGSGKSVIIEAFLNRSIKKMPGFKAVVLMGRVQLVMQFEERFKANIQGSVGTYCGTLGKLSTENSVTIASIQSIEKLENPDKIHLIVIDEVHNLNEKDINSRYFKFIEKLKNNNPKLKVVAFTASPYRATGYIYGEGKLFPRITYTKSLQFMIENGYLVKPKLKSVDEQFDVSKLKTRLGDYIIEEVNKLTSDEIKVKKQVIDALGRIQDRKKIIWQCSSIAHCELVYKILSEFEPCCIIHSQQSQNDQNKNKELFTEGQERHLVFVTIVSEGWDYPPTDAVVLMRPTKSPVMYTQVIGRGLRPFEGKTDCLVLDYGKVIENCGPLDNPRVNQGRSSSKQKKALVKVCPKCREYLEIKVKECHDCGHVFIKELALKSLTYQPSTNGMLLAEPVTVDIRKVELKKHVSKNGNTCLRIDYIFGLVGCISEYFVMNAEYGAKRLRKRCAELGLPQMVGINTLLTLRPTRIPTKIKYIERKYPEVLSLIF